MNTHKLITCPDCDGAGGHTETLDPSTRQQVGVMCEECYGAGNVLTTENTLPATIDSVAFVEVLGDYARNPSIENGMKVLRCCDTRLREHLAAMHYLARQNGYDQAIQERDKAIESAAFVYEGDDKGEQVLDYLKQVIINPN